MRYDVIDGIRGHLLIGMMLAHLGFTPGLGALLNFHHVRIIHLYDAEFFVVISGFLVGILTARNPSNPQYFKRFIRTRLGVIYRYYLVSAIPALLLMAFPSSGVAETLRDTLIYALNIILIQEGGAYSDILPIYLYSFLILSACYPIALAFGWLTMLGLSAGIYVLAQIFILPGLFGLSANFVIFDIGAWQLLFVYAFALGIHHRQARNWLRELSWSTRTGLLMALIAVFSLLRFGTADVVYGWFGLSQYSPTSRLHLQFPYLLSVLSFCLSFAIIMLEPTKITRPVNRLLNFYFSLGFLQAVGRYSIQMFVLHVYLMAFFNWASPNIGSVSKWSLALLLIAAFIAAPNLYVAWKKFRPGKPARVKVAQGSRPNK